MTVPARQEGAAARRCAPSSAWSQRSTLDTRNANLASGRCEPAGHIPAAHSSATRLIKCATSFLSRDPARQGSADRGHDCPRSPRGCRRTWMRSDHPHDRNEARSTRATPIWRAAGVNRPVTFRRRTAPQLARPNARRRFCREILQGRARPSGDMTVPARQEGGSCRGYAAMHNFITSRDGRSF